MNSTSSARALDARRLVVLLVDDSDDERDMYASYLEANGFQALQAVNAVDGFEMAMKYGPDIVVTDIAMPGSEDGLALTRRLKQEPTTGRTPVIVLSGHTFEVHREQARQARCDLFLAKPCLPSELKSAIDLLIRQLAAAPHVAAGELRRVDAAARASR